VIGVGVSGLNAAAIAADTQAEVILLDLNTGRLRAAGQIYRGQIQTLPSSALEIEPAVLGSGLIPGAKAPILIANELVARMKPDSTSPSTRAAASRLAPATHANPTDPVHGSVLSRPAES